MVYNLVKVFNKKVGIVINKASENSIIEDYALENNVNIIGRIPMDLELGRINSEGKIVASYDEYKPLFTDILTNIYKELNLWNNY